MEMTQSPIYTEVYRFLLSASTPEQVIAFKASDITQERVRHLLNRNKEKKANLTSEERAELDEFERVNHFMTMLKGYVRQQLMERK